MIASMEILDASGHLTLKWDPSKPEEVEKAKEEFNRLKKCGFAFFASTATDAERVKKLGDTGELDVRQIKEFEAEAERTVAVRPHRGG